MRSSRLFVGILMTALLCATQADAQQHTAVPFSVSLGDVVELGLDTSVSNPEFSWYMTQNQQFVEAQRGRIFQKRLTMPGTYNLDVSIKNEEGTQSDFQSFAITVSDQTTQIPPVVTQTSSGAIVARLITNPPMNNDGSVSLPPQGGVLTIDASPSTGPITQYAIDIDAGKDSNGNGNASDDIDNAQTFGLHDGTPLRYFIKPSSTQRTVIVHLSGNGVADATAQFSVRFDGQMQSIGQAGTPVTIQTQAQGLTTNFSAAVPAGTDAQPVLYQWNFGDGAQSLLTRPTHTYLTPGSYTVTVTIIDISNGQILFSGQQALTVEQNTTTSSSSSSVSSSEGNGSSSFPWKGIFIIMLLILLAIGAFLFLFWLKNKMTGGIQKKLETAEKKLFEEKNAAASGAAPPLQLKKPVTITQDPVPAKKPEKQEVVEREESRSEFQKNEDAQPVGNGPVPSWLKPSMATPAQSTASDQPKAQTSPKSPTPKVSDAPNPVPPPAPKQVPSTPPPVPKPVVAPAPKPAMQAPPPKAAPSPTAPLPSAPVVTTPVPSPAPVAPPVSKPSSAPMPVAPTPKPPVSKAPAQPSAPAKPASPATPSVPPKDQEKNVKNKEVPLPEPEKPIAFIRAESLEEKDEPPVQP